MCRKSNFYWMDCKNKNMYFLSFIRHIIILLELKLQHMNTGFCIALGWAGMQLIFFTVDHMVVCSEFVIKKLLVTHQCFGYCLHSVKFCSVPHSVPLSVSVTHCAAHVHLYSRLHLFWLNKIRVSQLPYHFTLVSLQIPKQ